MKTTDVPPTEGDTERVGPSAADDVGGFDEIEVFDPPEVCDERGVDPRMRERWIATRRDMGRRRLRVLTAVISVLGLVGVAYLVAASPLLGAGTIQVRGSVRTTPTAVRAAAQVDDGQPLLLLDEGAVARRVERLPYVQDARVSTELPDTVVIAITERRPVAWTRGTGTAPIVIVDGTGRVLEHTTAVPDLMTEVSGADAAPLPGASVLTPAPYRALREFPAALRLRALTLTVRGDDARLTLRGDPPEAGEVRFGDLTAVRRKSAAALAVLDALRSRGERVGYLDVRVPAAPATG